MNTYIIYLCYQPIKNMKYMGPKASIILPIRQKNKPLLQHNIDYNESNFIEAKSISTQKNILSKIAKGLSLDSIYHHIVVGFEGDKVLKCLNYSPNIGYTTVPEYKIINHGRIIADIIKKYNPSKYDGILINTDISCIITKPLDIDPSKNYIMYYDENHSESDVTCNIVDSTIEHMSFNSSKYYWSGICYLNNSTIRLLKFINTIKFTDPMFVWEIINYIKDHGNQFEAMGLNKKQYKYISNDILKATKV